MFVALLLDTSILIQGYLDPLDKVAISAVSIAPAGCFPSTRPWVMRTSLLARCNW